MRVANQEQCAIAKNADLVGGSGGTLGTPSGALLISVAICPSLSPSMDACNARRG